MLGGGGGWSVEKTGISAMIISSQIPFSIDLHYTEVKIQLSGPLLQGLTSRGGSVWFYGSTEMGTTSTGTQACKENVFIKRESRELPQIAMQQ